MLMISDYILLYNFLQQLLFVYEEELSWLDLIVNARISGCVRFGSRRFSLRCRNISISRLDGHELI